MKLLHKGNGEKPKYKEGDVVFLNNGNVVVVEEVGCSAGGKEFIYLAHYADDDAQYPILESEIGGLTDENGFAPQQHPEVAKDIRDFGYYVDYLNLEGSGTSDIDKFTSVILLFIPDAGWDDMESSDGKKIVTKKVISLLKRNNVPVSAVVAELKRVKAKQHIEIDNELGEGQNSAFEVGDTVTFKGSYGRLIYGIVQETKGNVASVRALDDNYATDIAVDELKLITIPKPYRDGGVIDDSPPYFFYIEDGDNKAIVKIGYPKRGNGEGNLKEFLVRGEEPYGFGSKNYQSYLTKSDIDGWLSKDYDYVEAIETEEDFDNYLPSESDKAKNGANIGENVDVNVAEFNKYFMRNYGFISHSLSNKEVQKFLDQDVIKRVSLPKKADYFQDYILANGLQDDIQLEKGAKIPQFEKLPRNRQANKKYAYFAVGKADGKIVEGWEIVYDVQSLKDSAPNDLRDNDYNPKDFRILSKQTIIRTMGINPHDLDNWRKFDYSNDVKPEQAKNGANIKGVGHTYENRGDWKRDLQTHDALMSGEGDDIKFLQGKIKYKQEGEHLVAYLGSIKMGYWDYSLNEGYIYDDKFKNGGNLEDNLLDFDIPTWALSSLINGDDSGLEDEDIEKLNNFTDKIVAKYGNAHFMIGSDEDMESEFTYRNDIDGTLGGDVVTLYLRPSKKYKNGANIEGGFGNENALMVINNNKQIKHHTEELNSVVNSDTEVPAWVVAKVNRSASDLSDATHYLEGVNSKYANGGGVGNIKSKINELYSKSNFINDSFNWKLKLLEMLQDRSIEAYNIYQSLTKEQKEEVLQEQYEVDNDMGSDGDGSIKTTKENLKILLNGAKNGNKYSNGGNTLGFNYSIGGL
jgi:ribosomal protein L35AE/L33A